MKEGVRSCFICFEMKNAVPFCFPDFLLSFLSKAASFRKVYTCLLPVVGCLPRESSPLSPPQIANVLKWLSMPDD
jgi:hypothetical protein